MKGAYNKNIVGKWFDGKSKIVREPQLGGAPDKVFIQSSVGQQRPVQQGYALTRDLLTDQVEMVGTSTNIGTQDFIWTFWLRIHEDTGAANIMRYTPNGDNSMTFDSANGTGGAVRFNAVSYNFDTDMRPLWQDNDWHFYVVTFDRNGNLIVRADNVVYLTQDISSDSATSLGLSIDFMMRFVGSGIPISMLDVRIYQGTGIINTDIAQKLYDERYTYSVPPGLRSNIEAWWPCDQQHGRVYDISGNGHDMVVNNFRDRDYWETQNIKSFSNNLGHGVPSTNQEQITKYEGQAELIDNTDPNLGVDAAATGASLVYADPYVEATTTNTNSIVWRLNSREGGGFSQVIPSFRKEEFGGGHLFKVTIDYRYPAGNSVANAYGILFNSNSVQVDNAVIPEAGNERAIFDYYVIFGDNVDFQLDGNNYFLIKTDAFSAIGDKFHLYGITVEALPIPLEYNSKNDVLGNLPKMQGQVAYRWQLKDGVCFTANVTDPTYFDLDPDHAIADYLDSGNWDSIENDGTGVMSFDLLNDRLECTTAGTVYNIRILDVSGNVLYYIPCNDNVASLVMYNADWEVVSYLRISGTEDWDSATQQDYFPLATEKLNFYKTFGGRSGSDNNGSMLLTEPVTLPKTNINWTITFRYVVFGSILGLSSNNKSTAWDTYNVYFGTQGSYKSSFNYGVSNRRPNFNVEDYTQVDTTVYGYSIVTSGGLGGTLSYGDIHDFQIRPTSDFSYMEFRARAIYKTENGETVFGAWSSWQQSNSGDSGTPFPHDILLDQVMSNGGVDFQTVGSPRMISIDFDGDSACTGKGGYNAKDYIDTTQNTLQGNGNTLFNGVRIRTTRVAFNKPTPEVDYFNIKKGLCDMGYVIDMNPDQAPDQVLMPTNYTYRQSVLGNMYHEKETNGHIKNFCLVGNRVKDNMALTDTDGVIYTTTTTDSTTGLNLDWTRFTGKLFIPSAMTNARIEIASTRTLYLINTGRVNWFGRFEDGLGGSLTSKTIEGVFPFDEWFDLEIFMYNGEDDPIKKGLAGFYIRVNGEQVLSFSSSDIADIEELYHLYRFSYFFVDAIYPPEGYFKDLNHEIKYRGEKPRVHKYYSLETGGTTFTGIGESSLETNLDWTAAQSIVTLPPLFIPQKKISGFDGTNFGTMPFRGTTKNATTVDNIWEIRGLAIPLLMERLKLFRRRIV